MFYTFQQFHSTEETHQSHHSYTECHLEHHTTLYATEGLRDAHCKASPHADPPPVGDRASPAARKGHSPAGAAARFHLLDVSSVYPYIPTYAPLDELPHRLSQRVPSQHRSS